MWAGSEWPIAAVWHCPSPSHPLPASAWTAYESVSAPVRPSVSDLGQQRHHWASNHSVVFTDWSCASRGTRTVQTGRHTVPRSWSAHAGVVSEPLCSLEVWAPAWNRTPTRSPGEWVHIVYLPHYASYFGLSVSLIMSITLAHNLFILFKSVLVAGGLCLVQLNTFYHSITKNYWQVKRLFNEISFISFSG